MEASEAAMADLKRILSERESDYGRADAVVNTSERGIDDCLTELRRKAARHLEPAGSSTGQANSGGR
jgi:XRE family aerobic/anaerobic benzoate catabolism transcriptional regulator